MASLLKNFITRLPGYSGLAVGVPLAAQDSLYWLFLSLAGLIIDELIDWQRRK